VLRPDSIRKECEASLRRLGVERIDLYQFHRPDETGTARRGLLATRWCGWSRKAKCGRGRLELRRRPARALRSDPSRGFLQPPFSLIRRDVAAREIPWCAEHDTGVIVYSPMQTAS